MNKYYIHCNNEQARYALINNAFYGRKISDLSANFETASFLSKNHIFISKGILNSEILSAGTSEMFSPVIVEIVDDESNSIPIWPVKRTDEGIIVSNELSKLSEIEFDDSCIGAFAFGDIPISLVSAFIFLNDKDKSNFRKPSPDLWFPQELFTLMQENQTAQDITLDEIKTASSQVDVLLSDEKIIELLDKIIKRNKKKASIYFMIDATDSWNTGSYLSNVDSYLINTLDGEQSSLREAVSKSAETFGEECVKEIIGQNEVILQGAEKSIKSFLFSEIVQFLGSQKGTVPIMAEEFSSWVKDLINIALDEYKDDIAKAMQVVNGYVYSRTIDDPDEALRELSGIPVAKAFMFFLDQQMNVDFLKNACKKLSQSERRDAYMMFAYFHGMRAVDGILKKNRLLEKRIEDVVYGKLSDEYLISSVPNCSLLPFCEGKAPEETIETYGILLSIKRWFSCEKSLEILFNEANEDVLTELYKLFGIGKAKENFLKYKDPIVITISCGDKSSTIEINYDGEELSKTAELKRAISKYSKGNSKIDFDKFKAYLENPEVYKKYYAKHCKEIQSICGSIK